MDKNFNPPAHPQPALTDDNYIRNEWQEGMSLRDYIAAAALQAIISNSGESATTQGRAGDCERAYAYADAMLAARQPKRPETIDDL